MALGGTSAVKERRWLVQRRQNAASNKVKIASGESLATARWAPDNLRFLFFQGPKAYIVGADGSGLRQLPSMGGKVISGAIWSPDQKSIYVSTVENAEPTSTTWKF
jgi:hypothetical protein